MWPLVLLLSVLATASAHQWYCPRSTDLTVAYSGGAVSLVDGGWTVKGGGAAATKAAFNLLGGSVDFDLDFSGTHPGVNANIYTISPQVSSGGGFQQSDYCDGARPQGPQWCPEVDWVESNGNCGGATTLHTIPGQGPNGCTAWGCTTNYHYNGAPSFHMSIKYALDGSWTVLRDGQPLQGFWPVPQASDWATVAQAYASRGAVIYSSQWVGWVPLADCGTQGDLGSSVMSIRNLKIFGTVTQGPTPAQC